MDAMIAGKDGSCQLQEPIGAGPLAGDPRLELELRLRTVPYAIGYDISMVQYPTKSILSAYLISQLC